MPKVATTAAAPAPAKAPAPKNGKPAAKAAPPRPVLYPTISVNGVEVPEDKMIVTVGRAKQLLDWVTEAEYPDRFRRDHPEFKGDVLAFPDSIATFTDEEGAKVACFNNNRNRPFSESWARQLAQDILNRFWCGPITMPGETVNGETIVVGRTGLIESGQHRLIALILASQMWKGKNADHWRKLWPVEPVIESLVVMGVSEASKVLSTLDQVKPRTVSDTIYTSEIFSKLNPPEKKECSRMLEKAVTFLWERTGAGRGPNAFNKFQTHSESQGFIDRHQRVVKCVRHLFEENADRALSKLKLSPGACAGAMYLMGASASDGDAYRNMEEPGEKKISWDAWDKAEEFWSLLGTSAQHQPARDALLFHSHPKTGEKVNVSDQRPLTKNEQFCILARAWRHLADPSNGKLTAQDLVLEYTEVAEEGDKLTAFPDFGGIDAGPKGGEPGEEEEQESVEARKERIRAEKADEALANAAKVAPPEAVAKEKAFVGGKLVGSTPDAKPAPSKEAQKQKLLENRANGKAAPAKAPLKGGIGGAPAPKPAGKTRAEIEAEMYGKA